MVAADRTWAVGPGAMVAKPVLHIKAPTELYQPKDQGGQTEPTAAQHSWHSRLYGRVLKPCQLDQGATVFTWQKAMASLSLIMDPETPRALCWKSMTVGMGKLTADPEFF